MDILEDIFETLSYLKKQELINELYLKTALDKIDFLTDAVASLKKSSESMNMIFKTSLKIQIESLEQESIILEESFEELIRKYNVYEEMRKNEAQDVKTTNGMLDIFTASLDKGV